MLKKLSCLFGAVWLAGGMSVSAAAAPLYLFYNAQSPEKGEIGISATEIASAFDDLYGPASDEIPDLVKLSDFYVAKLPDQSYRFFLNSSYNCAGLGCATSEYRRDKDGYLSFSEYSFQIKCAPYEGGQDKLLCHRTGYSKAKTPQHKPAKRGPVHYPAPRTAASR